MTSDVFLKSLHNTYVRQQKRTFLCNGRIPQMNLPAPVNLPLKRPSRGNLMTYPLEIRQQKCIFKRQPPSIHIAF